MLAGPALSYIVRLNLCSAIQRAFSIVLTDILYPNEWLYYTLISPLLMDSWAVPSLLL